MPEAWAMYLLKRFLPRTTRWLAGAGSRRQLAELERSGSSR